MTTTDVKFPVAARRRAKERAALYLEELNHQSIAQARLNHADSVSPRHVDIAAGAMDARVAKPHVSWTLMTIAAGALLGVGIDQVVNVFNRAQATAQDLVPSIAMMAFSLTVLAWSVPRARN